MIKLLYITIIIISLSNIYGQAEYRDGPSREYYDDGQLMIEKTYKDGKLDGPYKTYHDNGQLKEEETYKDGEFIDSKEY